MKKERGQNREEKQNKNKERFINLSRNFKKNNWFPRKTSDKQGTSLTTVKQDRVKQDTSLITGKQDTSLTTVKQDRVKQDTSLITGKQDTSLTRVEHNTSMTRVKQDTSLITGHITDQR